MDHPANVIGTGERPPGPDAVELARLEASGYPARDASASIAAISGEGEESPPCASVSGESDQVTEAVPMGLQQGLAGRPESNGWRA
jgi:hypothetical protein